jgi:PAS domain S-box-containing protein
MVPESNRLSSVLRQLEEAQRTAHVGSFEWDIATNVVTWSHELHRIYGLENGQFGGSFEAFLERVHPDDLAHTKDVIFTAFRNLSAFVYDHRIVRADGRVRTLHTRGDVIADEKGRPLRMSGSCWDVTELHEATESLERSLSLVEGTINATADGLLVVDRKGRVTAYNRRLLELWGLTRADIDKRGFEELLSLVHGRLENSAACLQRVRDLETQPQAESFDSLRFWDGRFYERYSRPQRIGDEIVGRVWSYRDVTEREQLLRRAVFLADATRLLASLDVEPALTGVAHLAVPYLGECCAIDLLGEDGPRRLTVVSRDPERPFTPELNPTVLAGHPALYPSGLLSCMAVPLVVKGAVVGVMTFIAPAQRRYAALDLELAEELARRAALSVENARLYRKAQEALRARDEFLSIAAHEIRGPLMSMHLAVQVLGRGSLADDDTPKVLEVIQREDRRLARFVDELLDLGRIRAGQLHFTFEEVDLAEVLHEVLARLGTELSRSGSALSVSTEGRTVGRWDRFRLEQVAANLLSNAVKFGQGKPIEVSVSAREGRAILVVRDHGIGISPDMQERVFRPFERGVSVRHFGGLGLGLHIARTIVDAFRGTLIMESELGKGSTFYVELPLARS